MYLAYFDGACEPINPGGTASYGAVILKENERVWECSELYQPPAGKERETSHNLAEYSGFIAILRWFAESALFDAEILIRGDSKMVIEQMFGTWKINQGKKYTDVGLQARELLQGFSNIRGEWIPRATNGLADELSKAPLKVAGVKFRPQPE
jgi:ribonuclease HI